MGGEQVSVRGGASGNEVGDRQTREAAAEISAGYGVRVELRPTLQPTRWVTSAGHFPSSRPAQIHILMLLIFKIHTHNINIHMHINICINISIYLYKDDFINYMVIHYNFS